MSDNKSALSPEDKVQQMLQHVITEIVMTESAYVKSLQHMVEGYYEPLRDLMNGEGMILNSTELNKIFGNVRELYRLHKQLLAELQDQGKSPGDVGRVFTGFSPYLKMYTAYLNNNAEGIELCAEIKNNKKSNFATFCQSVGGEGLESLMVKPVQRIPRYKMLLESLLKYTSESKLETRKTLQIALSKVSETVCHCCWDAARHSLKDKLDKHTLSSCS